MQTHNLKRIHKNKKRRQVGRGGKHAKTSGRGTKGQNARAGHKKRPEIRDFIKRIPKLRGRGVNSNMSIETKPSVVNIGEISKLFKNGDIVSPQALVKKGMIRSISGGAPRVKVLGSGVLDKKLSFEGCGVSESARVVIEKAGGSIR
ncbi:MAG TPA: uL15 family ribosomal protein [Candidatus Paceibacterota bacterium]